MLSYILHAKEMVLHAKGMGIRPNPLCPAPGSDASSTTTTNDMASRAGTQALQYPAASAGGDGTSAQEAIEYSQGSGAYASYSERPSGGQSAQAGSDAAAASYGYGYGYGYTAAMGGDGAEDGGGRMGGLAQSPGAQSYSSNGAAGVDVYSPGMRASASMAPDDGRSSASQQQAMVSASSPALAMQTSY